jgi:hypothetical protein
VVRKTWVTRQAGGGDLGGSKDPIFAGKRHGREGISGVAVESRRRTFAT